MFIMIFLYNFVLATIYKKFFRFNEGMEIFIIPYLLIYRIMSFIYILMYWLENPLKRGKPLYPYEQFLKVYRLVITLLFCYLRTFYFSIITSRKAFFSRMLNDWLIIIKYYLTKTVTNCRYQEISERDKTNTRICCIL